MRRDPDRNKQERHADWVRRRVMNAEYGFWLSRRLLIVRSIVTILLRTCLSLRNTFYPVIMHLLSSQVLLRVLRFDESCTQMKCQREVKDTFLTDEEEEKNKFQVVIEGRKAKKRCWLVGMSCYCCVHL